MIYYGYNKTEADAANLNDRDMAIYLESVRKRDEDEYERKKMMYDVNYQMQHLLTRASELRKSITDSKTSTKKQYYEKKFAKVQKQAIQMVVAIDQKQKSEALMEESVNAQAISTV